MTARAELPPLRENRRQQVALVLAGALVATGAAVALSVWIPPEHLTRQRLDLATPITEFFEFVSRDIEIFGSRFSEWTRAFAGLIAIPLDLLRGILADGFNIYRIDQPTIFIPPLPWFLLLLATMLTVARFSGALLGGLTGLFLVYVGSFGLWQSTMQTVAAVSVSVSATILLGLWLGIAAYRNRRLERVLEIVFDVMQTIPVFSYLVPLLVFFGFGPATALIATIIFAMPPMARVTALALKEVPEEINEFAAISGCTNQQQLWWVLLPAARQKLLLGVNQSVLFTLAMVIIASVIGAGGLGSDVLNALRGLRVGDAISAGLAITFLAILVDRILHHASARAAASSDSGRPRMPTWLLPVFVAALLGLWLLVAVLAPQMAMWPQHYTLPHGQFWNSAIGWINTHFGETLIQARDLLTTFLLRPVKDTLTGVPWPSTVLVLAGIGWLLGGWRFALIAAATFTLIALTGYWDRAMVSLYLVLIAALVSALIGIPIGVWAGLDSRAYNVVRAVIDVLQTLPTFVYLIPVVIIFGIGDVAALLAIVLFAIAPAIRYAAEGIRQTPKALLEAAEMSGATATQRLWLVQLPNSAPQIVLGLNQTLLMSFNMLVITALVGTRGLEQVTLQSIVRLNPGEGLVAGLAISVMAIVLSRMLTYASQHLTGHSLSMRDR
ncbi:MAG: ABC transporter permease subunit [Pseudomonadota bacterium]